MKFYKRKELSKLLKNLENTDWRNEVMGTKKWPRKYRFWRFLHVRINDLAHRRVPITGYEDHIRKQHWLWRLNDWVANHYTGWYASSFMKNRNKND